MPAPRPHHLPPWPALLAAISVAAACGASDRPARPVPAPEGGRAIPRVVRSNILREDYAGSHSCLGCHRDVAETWLDSPMRRMTRDIGSADVAAPFDGAVMRYRAETVVLETVDGRRYVRLESPGRADRLWQITRVIGGRTREDFAGVRVSGTGDGAARATDEMVLPATWVRRTGEWRYKGYSVMVPERPHLAAGPTWRKTCVLCHNTAPRVVSIYDDLIGPGAPPYQGNSTDDRLPGDRRWRWTVLDGAAAARAVRSEIARLGAEPMSPGTSLQTLSIQASEETYRRFGPGDLVEVGIGCEACHNGAVEHSRNPSVRPSLAVRSPALAFGPPEGEPTRAQLESRTCARCHSVLFSGYPYTWEGGRLDATPGGSHINSGEARDFLLGGCAEELSCTRCHDPHAPDRPGAVQAIRSPEGNALCVECHDELSGDDALRAHSHHEPGTPGAVCVACHMPRKNMGLGWQLTTYHRIGSPTDHERVLGDRPLECALCHGDATVASLVQRMEAWWGTRYDREGLARLYGGDLDVPALAVTLERGKPHERAVAAMALAEGGAHEATDDIAGLLDSDYPLVRYWAREALAELVGERPPLDMSLPGPELRRAGERWLAGR